MARKQRYIRFTVDFIETALSSDEMFRLMHGWLSRIIRI